MANLTIDKLITFIKENIKLNTSINDNNINSEQLQKELYKKLDFGNTQTFTFLENEFNEILNKYSLNLLRYGTINIAKVINDIEYNISLYFSLLLGIFDDFKSLPKDQQIQCIKKFVEKILLDISAQDLFKKFNYELYDWKKSELVDEIKKYNFGKRIIKFLSDYLHLNIWIFNYETDEINLSYCNNKINKFRDNIILFYDKGIYEIISYNDKFILNSDSEIIIYLYQNINNISALQFDFKNDIDITLQFGSDNLEVFSKKITQKINGANDIWLLNHFKRQLNEPNNKPNNESNNESNNKQDNEPNIEPNNKQDNEQNNEPNNKQDNEQNNEPNNKQDNEQNNEPNIESKNELVVESNNEPIKSVFVGKMDELNNEMSDDEINELASNKKVNIKMKLDELQQIALSKKISITTLVGGKQKNKTKEQLIKEING
jgi:hypothetical protein